MKKRVQPIRRKVRQLDWVMQWFTATHSCAICDIPLSVGYNKRNPGKSVTLHHTEGSREEDRWDDPEYVAKMVPCHVSCHRSYHLSKRHEAEGKKVPAGKIARMEENIQKALRRVTGK